MSDLSQDERTDINLLADEALKAGDYAQYDLCVIALTTQPKQVRFFIDASAEERTLDMIQEWALSLCRKAIAEAAAANDHPLKRERGKGVSQPDLVAYLMCPVSSSNGHTVEENVEVAEKWLNFLRGVTRGLVVDGQNLTIIAPWLANIRAGADEGSGADRAHGLRDDCAVAARCDLVIAVGHAPNDQLTGGMRLERDACAGPLIDLMDMGSTWAQPGPGAMWGRDRCEVEGRIYAGMREALGRRGRGQ